MSGSARVVLGLAALFAANFALTVAAFWVANHRPPGRDWQGHLVFVMLFGGVMTLALWLTFGDGKWYWRLVVCFVSIVATAFTMTWIGSQSANPSSFDENEAWWIMLVLLWLLLITFAMVWPLKRLRGWRLAWRRDFSQTSTPGQFSSQDLLFWTLAVAGVLGALRALAAVVPFGSDWVKQVALLLGVICLAVAAMYVANARSRVLLHAAALVALIVVISGLCAVVAAWEQIQAGESTIPWSGRFGAALVDALLAEAIPFFGLTLVVLLNCLALRALGCRLIRRSGESGDKGLAADFRG